MNPQLSATDWSSIRNLGRRTDAPIIRNYPQLPATEFATGPNVVVATTVIIAADTVIIAAVTVVVATTTVVGTAASNINSAVLVGTLRFSASSLMVVIVRLFDCSRDFQADASRRSDIGLQPEISKHVR